MTFLFFFEEKTYNENKKLHKEEKACENTQTRYIDNLPTEKILLITSNN